MLKAHQKLNAWKESMQLVKEIYTLTAGFPSTERYGLAAQMRRSAVSIPGNIAEGAARISAKEFRKFLAVSRGSVAELDTQLLIARDLGFAGQCQALDERLSSIYKMLNGLISHVQDQISPRTGLKK